MGLGPGHSPPDQETLMRTSSFGSRSTSRRQALLAERAARMRHAPTSAEALLFEALRGGKLGVSFRRQVPLLGRFIADLFASEVNLVVEADGLYHSGRTAADERRDRALVRAGYHVLRVSNELVMLDLEAAVTRIGAEVERLR